jgi:hypothetical protein
LNNKIIKDFLLSELLAARVIVSNKPEDYQKITLNNTVIYNFGLSLL